MEIRWGLIKRKGQMRIFEAIIACGLILIGHYFISHSVTSISKLDNEELETEGQNLLNIIEDQELLMAMMNQSADWAPSLETLVETILPPGVLYDLTITSLLSGEIIADNITNVESGVDQELYDATSVQGVYPFSYPIIQEKDVLIDIVMVVDKSGSMDDPIPGDPHNKIYYAKKAACNFVDMLNSTTDRVGLVAFATSSAPERDLTDDLDMVKDKINNLAPGGWTNMGGGISDSKDQYENYGRLDATWVMILLSDGIANKPIDEEYAREYALEQSQIVHSMGVKIYTIGLGSKDDIDEELLIEIQTDGYFYSPSAEELNDIFHAIGEDILFEVVYEVVLIQITLFEE